MKKFIILMAVLFAGIFAFTQTSFNSKAELFDIEFSIAEVEFPIYLYKDSAVVLKGIFENEGVKPIESIDITYQVGENAYAETYTLNNIHVETGDELEFYHDIPVTVSSAGDYTLTVMLTNVNGVSDTTRTSSVDFKVIDKSNEFIRTVLVEEFTTENCSNCPSAIAYLIGIIEEEENVILMAHHAGFGTDEYTLDESVALLAFYNAGGSTYAPAAMMDRHYNGLQNDYHDYINPGPVFGPVNPYGGNRMYDRLAQLSYADVNIDGTYNDETREVSVDVSGMFKADISEQLGLSVWIIEDGIITYEQAGATGRAFEHHGMTRAVLTDTYGDSIKTSTNTGDTYAATYQYTLPNDFEERNISVIAFVNYINDDINERSILNAKQFELNSLMTHYKTTLTVTNDNSEPVVNATFTIDDEDSYTTDENGQVELYLLDETYSYDIEKYGYEKVSGEFTVVDKELQVAEELVSKIKASFEIADVNGDPISRAEIKIVNVPTQVTDNEGETAFMLSPSTYSYTIESDGFDDIKGEFTLSDEDIIIEIVFIEMYDVTFNVTDEDNTAVDSALISIEGNDSTYMTNEDGQATITFEVGTYNYTVGKEGCATHTGDFTLTSKDKTINISLVYVSNIDREQNLVSVYPNPFSNELIIESSSDENASVTVYDIAGNVHIAFSGLQSKTLISTSKLDAGVYFVKISKNNKQHVFKVLK
jgi:hypothetical protein